MRPKVAGRGNTNSLSCKKCSFPPKRIILSVNNSRFVFSKRNKKFKEINLFIDLDALRIGFELVVNAGKHTKHDGGIILAKATYLCVIVSLIDHKSSITPSPSLISPHSPPRSLSGSSFCF